MLPRTMPESPATLKIQLDQLSKGLRKVVLFPKGSSLLKRPAGMKSYQDAEGNTWIYNPKLTNVGEIDRARDSSQLPELLGPAKGGMGAPDKSQLSTANLAVVGRTPKGETTQSTATDPQHEAQTIAQTWKVTPPGGSVSTEPPTEELAHRLSAAQGGVELNRGTSEVPLTDAGRRQAEDLAKQLPNVDAIYCGPLSRTRDTAQAIADAQVKPVPITVVPGLRPPAEGRLEGQPKAQTRPITDQMAIRDRDQVAPGQGPISQYPGESYNQWWLGNVFPSLQPILARYRQNPNLRIVLVTHSRDLKAIEAWVAAGAREDGTLDPKALESEAPDTGTVERLYLKGNQWAIDQQLTGGGIFIARHGETEWNEGGSVPDKKAETETHEFSSTQVNLPYPLAGRVRREAMKIPDEDLADDGREDRPHVTVKYGLHGEDPEPVRRLLENEPPIRLRLGKTKVFPANADRKSDVIHAEVRSPDLLRLNKKVSDSLEHTDTHPGYTPHATLAYVKPGKGKKYANSRALDGFRAVVDHVIFSSKSGQKHKIRLTGGKPQATSKDATKSEITRLVEAKQHQQAYDLASRATASGQLTHDDADHAVDRGLMPRHAADAIAAEAIDRMRQILTREFDRWPKEQQDAVIERLRDKPGFARQLLQGVA